MNTQHIISHDSCPDGIASAMIAVSRYPSATVEFVNYNTPAWSNLTAREGMLFVDMSPPPARVQEFIAVGVRVLDHHVTAAELVRSIPNGTYDPNACGALMTLIALFKTVDDWEQVGGDVMPTRFAQLADVRDRWLRDSPDWSEACAQAAALMFYDREVLLDQARGGGPWLVEGQQIVGRLLEAKRERDAINAADKAIHSAKLDGGISVAFVNDTSGIISDAAEVLRSRGVNLIVGFRMSASEIPGFVRCDYSLRSDARFNCATFCKRFGGGGHERAAGFNRNAIGDPLADFYELLAGIES